MTCMDKSQAAALPPPSAPGQCWVCHWTFVLERPPPSAGPPAYVSEPLLIYDLLRRDWTTPSSSSSSSEGDDPGSNGSSGSSGSSGSNGGSGSSSSSESSSGSNGGSGSSSSSESSSGSNGSGSSSVRVFASSFDAFVDEVLAALPSLNLLVVTGVIQMLHLSHCLNHMSAC